MNLPWANKTGLAKAATILGATLLLSGGLCGVNFVAVTLWAPDFISEGAAVRSLPTRILSFTAAIELYAIALSLLGLVVVCVFMLIRALLRKDP